MATFKIVYCYHAVNSRYILHAFSKTCKPYALIRPLSFAQNVKSKFKHNNNVIPVIGFMHSKISEVFHSSKSVRNKPVNVDSLVDYENVAEETLQSILDRFEELLQNSSYEDWDANYSNGVLTVTLDEKCIYVINKQTPNRQIWLSSPISGPKRYDYMNGTWIYKHDGLTMHQLLSDELSQLLQRDVDFLTCTFSN